MNENESKLDFFIKNTKTAIILIDINNKSKRDQSVGKLSDPDKISNEIFLGYVDLYMETAGFFIRKNLYDDALQIFSDICSKAGEHRNEFVMMEALQGQAYCYYLLDRYSDACGQLELLLKKTEDFENAAWKIKTMNDIAACMFLEDDIDSALDIWNNIKHIMIESDVISPARQYRNVFNRTMCYTLKKSNPKVYLEEWERLKESFHQAYNTESAEYINCLYLDGWRMHRKGQDDEAVFSLEQAINLAHEVLPENSKQLTRLKTLCDCCKENL